MRTTKVISVSLPPPVAKEFESMARVKGKSSLFREMIAVYKRSEWREKFQRLQAYGAKKAREAKAFTEDDIERLALGGR